MSEKPESCDACQFETVELTAYPRRHGLKNEGEKWLCNLCACTHSGMAVDYNGQYDVAERCILATLCYIGNVILSRLPAPPSQTGEV